MYCVRDLLQMEKNDYKSAKHKNVEVSAQNGVSNVCKQIEGNSYVWQKIVTKIDLSGRNIATLDDKMTLPANLVQLNLSHNKLVEVPAVVLNLEKLVLLNLSHNNIEYFDDNPKFCHALELLDMSHNKLAGPPYWVWAESPEKLIQLNLSNNAKITNSLLNDYLDELLQYSTLVTEINLQNCNISKHTELLTTFPKVKSLCLGEKNYKSNANTLIEVPCPGLDKCCDLIRLNVCNTHTYTVNPSIEVFKNLIEINLALNNLSGLPNEFCNLENLEICVLSCNKILYLPEDINKLQKLVRLYLDGNELCMLPETLGELPNLRTLDLYDNNLNEVLDNFSDLEELDLALNYFQEPEHSAYLEKKEMLRLTHENRYNGRKNVINKSDEYSEKESDDEDDEELYDIFFNGKILEVPPPDPDPLSSPEDWDSDDYWVPCHQKNMPEICSQWLRFVKQKIREGNFCPIDAHPVSIAEKVKYEKLCNPQRSHESDGQFDDYSSDDT